MMHGGLGGVLGRWYEHLACGVIRRCGFPFYGVSGDVCRWLKDLRHHGGWHAAKRRGPRRTHRPWPRRNPLPPGGRNWSSGGRPPHRLCGAAHPEKGALRLAEAVQQLPGCVLAVAGTGPEEEALRALGGPVRVLGALPHPQIVQLLHQADCYCLPTEYAEGFPTTLLEAAACGCPIL